MSVLLNLRREIKAVLLAGGLWEADAVIVNRRLKIWNEVARAINSSKHGAVMVVGTAKADADRNRKPRSPVVMMDVTLPLTLIELPKLSPEAEEEDLLWERSVALLQGNPLGRPARSNDFVFSGFEEVPDDHYVIRQTLFRTRVILN